MRYLTPRKAALGLGASGRGTADFWAMTVSAVALAVLTPLFLWTVGSAIGLPRAGVAAHFARPGPAVITGLFLIVGARHWITGTRILIDDYVHGPARAPALIASQIAGWLVIALSVYALGRLALAGVAA